MSTFPPQYPCQPDQLLFEPITFGLVHNDSRRSKTPTDSLINHTGLSPGGLSPGPLITTPPPLSRNPSQQPAPPQDQPPEQLHWDHGSFSNSPTSVRTPDNDSFEVEMLDPDMRNFYHQDANIMTTQSSHSNVPAVDSSMFFTSQGMISDQGMSDMKLLRMYANKHSNPGSFQRYNGCRRSTVPAAVQHA
jgi:hypothetical protein